VPVELEAPLVREGRSGLDAQQRRLRLLIAGLREVRVVGREVGRPKVSREPYEVRHDAALDLGAVVHQLDVVVLASEDVLHLPRGLQRGVVLPEAHPSLNLARGAPRRADQSARVSIQEVPIDSGLVELALEGRERAHAKQVVEPGVVASPEGRVRVCAGRGDVVGRLGLVAPLDPRAVRTRRPGGDVGLEPDDRLDSRRPRLGPEVVRAEQESVVRDPHRGLAKALSLGEEVVHARRAVEHRVVRVHVQVDELARGHGPDSRLGVGGADAGPARAEQSRSERIPPGSRSGNSRRVARSSRPSFRRDARSPRRGTAPPR
jgi:hypothetical protein